MSFHLTTWEYVAFFAFTFVFGGLKSGFGVAGVLVTPALSLLIDPRLAVVLMGPVALWTDIAALRNHWKKWNGSIVRRMLPATILGTLIGSQILAGISTVFLNRLLAVVTVGYGVVNFWKMWQRSRQAAVASLAAEPMAGGAAVAEATGNRAWLQHIAVASFAGVLGATIGALSHAGGIVLTFYLLALGLQMQEYIATLVSLFFIQNLLKLPLYAWVGVLTPAAFGLTLLTIPLVFAGGWLGKRINRRLSARQFDLILNSIILLVGLMLLFK